MLQAMNTGHEGSLTTIHANDTRDALARLEMMVAMTGFELPIPVVRQYIAAGIRLVVHLARLKGGVRRVTRVSEIVERPERRVPAGRHLRLQATGTRRPGRRQRRRSTRPAIGRVAWSDSRTPASSWRLRFSANPSHAEQVPGLKARWGTPRASIWTSSMESLNSPNLIALLSFAGIASALGALSWGLRDLVFGRTPEAELKRELRRLPSFQADGTESVVQRLDLWLERTVYWSGPGFVPGSRTAADPRGIGGWWSGIRRHRE